MVFAFDTFNYGNMFDFNAEFDWKNPPETCYYCFEGNRPNAIVWVNGDNEPFYKNDDGKETKYSKFTNLAGTSTYSPSDWLKSEIGKKGCIYDCVKAKEVPSTSDKEEEEGEEEGEEEEEYQKTGNGGNYSYPPQQQNTNLVPLVVGGALLLGLVVIIS